MGALNNNTVAMLNTAFGEAVGAGIAAKAEASPFLVGLLNAFAANGGTIELKNRSNAAYCSWDGKVITIGSNRVVPDVDGFLGLAITLAEETSHALLPGGRVTTLSDFNTFIGQAMDSEGIGLNARFIVAAQLGYTQDPILSSARMNVLDQIYQNAGLNVQQLDYSSFFNVPSSATSTAADFIVNEEPSNAPNLTYHQYYEDQWVINVCYHISRNGIDPNAVDWTNM